MKTLKDPYKVRLFTYGTLKKQGRLAQLVASGEFLGEYHTLHAVFDLVDYHNSFPIAYLKHKEGMSIIGELYEIDLKTMDMINRMESNADYTPIIVEIVNEGNTLTNAMMFVNITDEEQMKAVGFTQRNIVNEKGHKEWIN
jgi:gamma-glutamylcyclotransferase (GGCT)/AIG2-like uncharacterized protein YtfP|tara:strand:- start:626 stop:1048 length:423 start_codon:yes stop_codon:yes gene_type:complete